MAILTRRRIGSTLKIGLIVGMVGPWPVDTTPYPDSAWCRSTEARLGVSPGKRDTGELLVGVARVDLTPARPVPLAGFIGQIGEPYAATDSPCWGKALTLVNRVTSVTILAVDLLLIDQKLAQAILARTGLNRDQIYFTATHSHSGPGGWGNHPLERLVAGTFRPEVFDHLADQLAEVVLASRRQVRPVEVGFTQVTMPGLQRNRIAPGEPTNDVLSAWIFRSTASAAGRPIVATLVSFGAHATIAHSSPPRLGGDYPGAFGVALTRLVDAGVVLFAAGSVGDASPVRFPVANPQRGAEAYGKALAAALAGRFGSVEFQSRVDFGNLGLDVDLPAAQVPFLVPALRCSRLLTWWIGRRQTYLHCVRIGPAALLGFPGDYSGHLAAQLRSLGIPVVATSFNGDYKGYLVSEAIFRGRPCYETRWMSFFGPNLGDYLTAMGRRCVGQLLEVEPGRDRPFSPGGRF